MKRPLLNKSLKYSDFKSHYYLKDELVVFCRENGLSSKGNKDELTLRVGLFIKKGIMQKSNERKYLNKSINKIELNMIIEDNFRCSEKHREFFRKEIGSNFKFKVLFQKWLKDNSNKKTYKEAIKVYHELSDSKEQTVISKQFEYNQYIRDFFRDNDNLSLNDAIRCWYYKRDRKGSNKYDKADLQALLKE